MSSSDTFRGYPGCLTDPGLIYLREKGEMWLFGGWDWRNWTYVDHIHKYLM